MIERRGDYIRVLNPETYGNVPYVKPEALYEMVDRTIREAERRLSVCGDSPLSPWINKTEMSDAQLEAWLEVRRQAGKLDPETAEIMWEYGMVVDPYGIYQLPPEYECFGRNYFARPLGSDIWVSFHDLPKATVTTIWKKLETQNRNSIGR